MHQTHVIILSALPPLYQWIEGGSQPITAWDLHTCGMLYGQYVPQCFLRKKTAGMYAAVDDGCQIAFRNCAVIRIVYMQCLYLRFEVYIWTIIIKQTFKCTYSDIRSCDEYTCLSPRPLSHCTLVWCCVMRQSSPSPSTPTKLWYHTITTVHVGIAQS